MQKRSAFSSHVQQVISTVLLCLTIGLLQAASISQLLDVGFGPHLLLPLESTLSSNFDGERGDSDDKLGFSDGFSSKVKSFRLCLIA
ncbi:hypothetical protein ACHQM5_001588 [Ranunculus cassubicifolius]